jgi:hypothetical protein
MDGMAPKPERLPTHTPVATAALAPRRVDALGLALTYHNLLLALDHGSVRGHQRDGRPAAPPLSAHLRAQADSHARHLMEELSAFSARRQPASATCRAVRLLLDVAADVRTPAPARAVPLLIEEGAARMDLYVPKATLVEAMLILLSLAADGCGQAPRLSLTVARLSPLAARLSGLTKRAHLRLSVGAPTDAEELAWRPSLVALRAAAVQWRGRLLRTANTTGGWRLCLDLPAREVA